MNMRSNILQSSFRADHTCSAAKAHGHRPPQGQITDQTKLIRIEITFI
jgi:hypothetical protein